MTRRETLQAEAEALLAALHAAMTERSEINRKITALARRSACAQAALHAERLAEGMEEAFDHGILREVTPEGATA